MRTSISPSLRCQKEITDTTLNWRTDMEITFTETLPPMKWHRSTRSVQLAILLVCHEGADGYDNASSLRSYVVTSVDAVDLNFLYKHLVTVCSPYGNLVSSGQDYGLRCLPQLAICLPLYSLKFVVSTHPFVCSYL